MTKHMRCETGKKSKRAIEKESVGKMNVLSLRAHRTGGNNGRLAEGLCDLRVKWSGESVGCF